MSAPDLPIVRDMLQQDCFGRRINPDGPEAAEVIKELYEAAVRALNYIENTEDELGITLDTGGFLRAAIAKARGEEVRP